jgi:hypothetical protein
MSNFELSECQCESHGLNLLNHRYSSVVSTKGFVFDLNKHLCILALDALTCWKMVRMCKIVQDQYSNHYKKLIRFKLYE